MSHALSGPATDPWPFVLPMGINYAREPEVKLWSAAGKRGRNHLEVNAEVEAWWVRGATAIA